MQHFEEREIDGHAWKVQAFPATKGAEMAAMLLQHMASLASGADNDIFQAVAELIKTLTPKRFVELVKDILSTTLCDGKGVLPQFDVLFMQNYSTMIKAAVFALEVNFKAPFDDFKTLMASLGSGTVPPTEEGSSVPKV